VRKNARTIVFASVNSNALARSAQTVSARNGGEQPRESKSKCAYGRCIAHLGHAKAHRFKDFIDSLLFGHIEYFFIQQPNIDHADDAPTIIDDWESQELVEHERFAGLKDGRGFGDCEHAFHHDVVDEFLLRRSQQPASRQNAHEFLAIVYHVEVSDSFTQSAFANGVECLLHGEDLLDRCEILARDCRDRLAPVLLFGVHPQSLTRPVAAGIEPISFGTLLSAATSRQKRACQQPLETCTVAHTLS